MVDNFAHRASTWDNSSKIDMTDKFLLAMFEKITPQKNWKALEIGAGTGLVGFQVLPSIDCLVFEDTSEAMLEVLMQKLEGDENVEIVHGEIFNYKKQDIDLIFSSMAFHHIPDIEAAISHLYSITKPGASVVIGDIRTEDGSFHHFEPIPHKGFDTDELSVRFSRAGFKVLSADTYNILQRERIPGQISEYEQFLLIAKKES
ncbi:MAG: class I SAM-dependent methyltransferase [Paludibacter sp.]|jgi:ubiquinone/menaquinone biosynthesis C-methylase UbiE